MADVDERRIPDGMLIALSASSGAVDAISWLALGKVFSAFMTGNFAFLGFVLAGAGGPSALTTAISLGAFGVGAFGAARLLASAGPDPARSSRVGVALGVVLVVQAAFWVLWLRVVGRPTTRSANLLIAVMALAMGAQSAAVFSSGVRSVFTTAATATWVLLMGDLANPSTARPGERGRLLGVVLAIFVGALTGAWLVVHTRDWAPLLPLAITAGVVAAEVTRSRHLRSASSRGAGASAAVAH